MSEGNEWSERLRLAPVGDGVVAGEGLPEQRRMVMQFQLVKGSSFVTAVDHDAGACADMDAAVWGRMPEEVMWEVLRFVPAAKRFQLQLLSRKWRQVLTSTHFRNTLAQSQSAEQHEHGVMACVWPKPWPPFASGGSSNGKVVLEVDLTSMVPSSFWSSVGYSVVAAAHGLVCISNDSQNQGLVWEFGEPWTKNSYCVLNPLTRTCIVLPELPFQPDRWLLPSITTIAILDSSGTACRWATYDLAAGNGSAAGWVSAHMPVPRHGGHLRSSWRPMGALLGGEAFWYTESDNRVHVLAQGPGPGEQVEVGVLDAPSPTLLGLGERTMWCDDTFEPSAILMAHRGAIYFVAQMMGVMGGRLVDLPNCRGVVSGVWRLARERLEWEGVALLGQDELELLTGLRRGRPVELCDAYGVRELVCCQVVAVVEELDAQHDLSAVVWLLGFNLDTGEWQLLHGGQGLMAAEAMELRPDLFLS